MSKKAYILIITIIALFSCTSIPKAKRYSSLYTDVKDKYYLNGPVKQVLGFDTLLVNKINLSAKDSIEWVNESTGFRSKEYIGYTTNFHKFNKYGLLLKWHGLIDGDIREIADNDTTTYFSKGKRLDGIIYKDKIYIYIYIYDQKDIKEKLKIKQTYKPLRRVYNPYRVYVNSSDYETYAIIVRKDSQFLKIRDAFTYKIDKKRITQENKFTLYDDDLVLFYNRAGGTGIDSVLDYTTKYNYNENSQLITKKIDFKSYNPDFNEFGITNLYSSNKYDENPYEVYTYNDNNQLTEVVHYDYRDPKIRNIMFKENYTYGEDGKLVYKKFITGYKLMGRYIAVNGTEFYFNEKLEATKIIKHYDGEFTNPEVTYHIKYEGHDKYNNWLNCYVYLNDGTQPIKHYRREITYYEEEEKTNKEKE